MLTIKVPMDTAWDEANKKFTSSRFETVELEHSLASLSKWESIHEKPFLSDKEKTTDEVIDYIRCMLLTPDVAPKVFELLVEHGLDAVHKYISSKQTATWFRDDPNARKSREVVTAEVLYYNMTALNIPFECDKWHLNRLLTLMRVANEKNKPKKKTNRRDVAAQQREIARQRREQYKTRG